MLRLPALFSLQWSRTICAPSKGQFRHQSVADLKAIFPSSSFSAPNTTATRCRSSSTRKGRKSSKTTTRKERHLEQHPGNGEHIYKRRSTRHGEASKNGNGRSRLFYYATPEPPPPPKFSHTSIVGMAWTRPSSSASQNQYVKQVLTNGLLLETPGTKINSDESKFVNSDGSKDKNSISIHNQRRKKKRKGKKPPKSESSPKTTKAIDDDNQNHDKSDLVTQSSEEAKTSKQLKGVQTQEIGSEEEMKQSQESIKTSFIS